MPTNKAITITVTNGYISCNPSGGHIRARQQARLEWDCDEGFTLAFALLDGNNTPAWPFKDPPQPPAQKTTSFIGTLRDVGPNEEAPAYKYSITVGNQTLDPIIIVDK